MKLKALPVKALVLTLFGLSYTISGIAQVMWACNDPEGGIQIWFDYSQNCPNSPGSLAGMQEIGFHSGANGWASVVDWNNANAVTGINMGSDTFVVDIDDLTAYYGTTTTAINFVFNQGPADAANPWNSEGKADDGVGGCADFYLDLTTLTQACPMISGLQDLQLEKDLIIAPNPISETATISFENTKKENYRIQIRNATGQLVHELKDFNGDQFSFSKERHPAGFYTITLINEKGQFFTGQMVLQ